MRVNGKDFYAPDDSGDWVRIGPATKRRWPRGIPEVITCSCEGELGDSVPKELKDKIPPDASIITVSFKEYAGDVYARVADAS